MTDYFDDLVIGAGQSRAACVVRNAARWGVRTSGEISIDWPKWSATPIGSHETRVKSRYVNGALPLERPHPIPLPSLSPVALKSVPQGAATQVYVATKPKAATQSGEYWKESNVAEPRSIVNDEALVKKLRKTSEEIVAKLPS